MNRKSLVSLISIFIITAFIQLIFVHQVYAGSQTAYPEIMISIDAKNPLVLGDHVQFTYSITTDQPVNIIIEPFIHCTGNSIHPFITTIEVFLEPETPYVSHYHLFQVDEFTDPQICTASVYVSGDVEAGKASTMEIITLPRLVYQLGGSTEPFAESFKTVYSKGETIQLNKKGLSPKMTMYRPDSSVQDISTSNTITLDSVGEYVLYYEVEKPGFRPFESSVRFAVIDSPASPVDGRVCNANGICEAGETVKNCPQDCRIPDEEAVEITGRVIERVIQRTSSTVMIVGMMIVLAFFIIIQIIRLKKQ